MFLHPIILKAKICIFLEKNKRNGVRLLYHHFEPSSVGQHAQDVHAGAHAVFGLQAVLY